MQVNLQVGIPQGGEVSAVVIGQVGVKPLGNFPGIGHAIVIAIRRRRGRRTDVGGQQGIPVGVRAGTGWVNEVFPHRLEQTSVHRVPWPGPYPIRQHRG